MNLIEAFTNEQLKKEVPLVRVGDTVRVHNKIKEGNRERIQMFEFPTVSALKRPSRFILRMWRRWILSASVRSDARSCTICAAESARLPKSKSRSDFLGKTLRKDLGGREGTLERVPSLPPSLHLTPRTSPQNPAMTGANF